MRLAFVALVTLILCACAPSTSAPQVPEPTPDAVSPTWTPAPPPIRCEPPYPTGTPTAETVFCADPAALEQAMVVRVVDGDTIRVLIDGVEEPVRFYGIDTPERGEPCFDEATDRTRALVAGEVRLRRDARDRDRFDRLLRYVYTDEGLSIDALLVGEGLAYAWREDGRLRAPLLALEDLARALQMGCLWSSAG